MIEEGLCYFMAFIMIFKFSCKFETEFFTLFSKSSKTNFICTHSCTEKLSQPIIVPVRSFLLLLGRIHIVLQHIILQVFESVNCFGPVRDRYFLLSCTVIMIFRSSKPYIAKVMS